MKPIFKLEKMNKMEAAYAQRLDFMANAGEIVAYRFEPFGLKLAPKTFYHPDFLLVHEDFFSIHETKGFWRDDARAKIKVAAKMFPWFKFVAVQWKGDRKYLRGEWVFEEF